MYRELSLCVSIKANINQTVNFFGYKQRIIKHKLTKLLQITLFSSQTILPGCLLVLRLQEFHRHLGVLAGRENRSARRRQAVQRGPYHLVTHPCLEDRLFRHHLAFLGYLCYNY